MESDFQEPIGINNIPMNCWITIIDFLDIRSFFNFELSNKECQTIISQYYTYKENIVDNNVNHSDLLINHKLQFLSKRYFNAIIEGSVTKEYYNDDINEQYIEHKNKYSNLGNIFVNFQFKQIDFYTYNNLCILYNSNLIQIYTFDKTHRQLKLKYKINQTNKNDLTCFVFIPTHNIFIFTDIKMNFYTLALPNDTISNVNELTLNEVKTNIKFNIKGELNFPITNLYYIKNYIIFLDEKENFYYMIYDNFPIYKSDGIDCVYPLAITRTYEKIISISASHSFIMVMDNTYTLHYISGNDIPKTKTIEIQFHTVNEMKFNNFYTMHNSESHSLILEKQKMPPLEQYTNAQVYSWFEEMGLDDYLNIIKYEKITGKDIVKADKTFFINCLGMEEEEINKVNYEISKIKNGYFKNVKLWGCGSNKYGQLVIADMSKPFCKTYQKIIQPELSSEMDSIEKVYCGKSYSILISHNGNVYITGNYLAKDKVNKNEENVVVDQKGNKSKKNNHIKDNNKKLMRKNVKKEKKTQEMNSIKERWVDVTKDICFDSVCDDKSLFFKVKNILLFKEEVLFFGSQSSSIPFCMVSKKPKFKHEKKGEKFIACDKLIKIVLSYKNEIINTFTVVYSDAKLKMLETKLLDFLESEVQYHKIEQIKKMGEIIWDRKKRYLNQEFSTQMMYCHIAE